MKSILTILVFFSAISLSGQGSLVSAGGNFLAGNSSHTYSIGQLFSSKSSNGSLIFIDGIYRPFNTAGLSQEELSEILGSIIVYPNPSSGAVTVETTLKLGLHVYSSSGQLIVSREYTKGPFKMDLSSYSPGLYTLVFLNERNLYLDHRRILIQ